MTTLKIGELASQGRVNLETIRYYEREGLIRQPKRTSSGHRAYLPADLVRLRFIKQSQAPGFTLTETRDLQAIRRMLLKMKASCEGRCSVSECPILESLDSEHPS